MEVRGRQVQIVGVDPRSYRRGTARPERLADSRRRPAHSPLPLSAGDRPAGARRLRSRPVGPPPRRADHGAVPGRPAPVRPPAVDVRRGGVRAAGRRAPSLRRPRDDVRPVSVLRETGGLRAGPTLRRSDHSPPGSHRRDPLQRADRLPRLCVLAVAARADDVQAQVDRAGRGRLGSVGHRVRGRRRPCAGVDAVRAVGALSACRHAAGRSSGRGRRADHVRVPRRGVGPVGHAVTLPRCDRGRARARREGDRGVRLPVRRGRVDRAAVPRPPNGLPERLPRGLRLPNRAAPRARRAGAPGARRSRPGRGEGARRSSSGACARCSSRNRRRCLADPEG